MRNKLIVISALLAASTAATAKVSLTENIALEGFVDMSYASWDAEYDNDKESDNSFAVDQAEVDFLFDFSPVTAQVDVQYLGSNDDDEIELEQAFASYALGNGGAVSAGRYVSFLGLEAVEPTGLYQYSYAYASFSGGSLSWIPGYNEGVKYTVENESGFFGLSIQDGVWSGDKRFGGDDESSWGAEVAAAFTGTENLTLFLGGAYEEAEYGANTMDTWLLNGYVSYEADKITYGAELNYGESEDVEHLSGLVMANFAYSEKASVTGRISYVNEDEGNEEVEGLKFTAAHLYAFTDNLALNAEISYLDGKETWSGEGSGEEDFDELSGGLQLLFSF